MNIQPHQPWTSLLVIVWLSGCAKPPAATSLDAPELFALGEAHYERAEWDKAVAAYTRAAEQEGAGRLLRSMCFNNRGMIQTMHGRHESAIADFTKAIELDPNFLKAYLNRGGSYYDTGKFKKALEDCDAAIRLAPEDPNIYRNRAMVHRALGDEGKATADEARAEELGEG